LAKNRTRKSEYNENQQTLFTSFELGDSKWLLGFSIGLGQKARKRTVDAGKPSAVQQEIKECGGHELL
jgi:hypothetical protein